MPKTTNIIIKEVFENKRIHGKEYFKIRSFDLSLDVPRDGYLTVKVSIRFSSLYQPIHLPKYVVINHQRYDNVRRCGSTVSCLRNRHEVEMNCQLHVTAALPPGSRASWCGRASVEATEKRELSLPGTEPRFLAYQNELVHCIPWYA